MDEDEREMIRVATWGMGLAFGCVAVLIIGGVGSIIGAIVAIRWALS